MSSLIQQALSKKSATKLKVRAFTPAPPRNRPGSTVSRRPPVPKPVIPKPPKGGGY